MKLAPDYETAIRADERRRVAALMRQTSEEALAQSEQDVTAHVLDVFVQNLAAALEDSAEALEGK